ncbi:alpha-mannosyltransferase [Aspergillus brunneoviolaceus CBS 621.78]|uniref:Alpha-1,2-mannosyltransferase n=1 Tax=Aspergillus brunneoviolaceus CBS 621.78 TaxID=1450534 RepID=A0ACD1G0Z8_9EURO|nr:putative alpha-1,2-mannosyltransferase [Aspergillus brunneoviolaceus CBS 621.78]RAH42921.1 putative alpha-1,2-mannosyltransferase [Aspergillus brunneoviolaceus CBS 621.78]
MFPSRAALRIRIILAGLFLVLICSQSFSRWHNQSDVPEATSTDDPAVLRQAQLTWRHATEGHIEFWRQFLPLLTTYEPKCLPPLRLGMAPSIRFEQADPYDQTEFLDLLPMDIEDLQQTHRGFLDAIQTTPPQLNYTRNTRGLVSTAGGSYLPVLVLSLRMLRRTGSQLPVEVFLASEDEYETYICDVILPSLNAQCIVLSTILNAIPHSIHIQKYQFKLFAMLFSSFEEILFLDADAYALFPPETLFTRDPFLTHGLITWPDFWATTISPSYYAITGQPTPRPPTRPSSESGEVLLSKRTHLRTLLLSTYYNIHGPEFYYPLLSQGAAGEGDKETFVAAALALAEPHYQVAEPLCAIGHTTQRGGGFAGSAMVQFDPAEDFDRHHHRADTPKPQPQAHGFFLSTNNDSTTRNTPRAFFIHANYPKFDPATVFDAHEVNPAIGDDGRYTRAWTGPPEIIRAFGRDVEKEFWEEIRWTACELEGKFRSWEGKKGICKRVKKYYQAMYGGRWWGW